MEKPESFSVPTYKTMKTTKILPIITLALTATCMTTGCGDKKKTNDIITTKPVKKAPAAPIKMQEYHQSRETDFAGSRLVCDIQRTADDSLSMVADEYGQKFVDNRITLTIKRPNGTVFFAKTFTKATFDSYLDDDYRKTGILEGLVFDKVEDGTLKFAASVSHPQTDEYIPLVVAVNANGTMTLSRDTQLDTNANDEDDDR